MGYVVPRQLGEIFPDLVGEEMPLRSDSAQQGHGQSAWPYSGLHNLGAGKNIRPDENGPDILGINDLGLAREIGDELRQRWPEDQKGLVHRGAHDEAFFLTDDFLDGNRPSADRDFLASLQSFQALPFLAVVKDNRLAFAQRPSGIHP